MLEHNFEFSDRECTRLPKDIEIETKKLEYPLPDNPAETGISRDIAKKGICFTTATNYQRGDRLSLSMKLKGWHRHRKGLTTMLADDPSKTDVLTVIAEVVWSMASETAEGYDIGVRFINIYEDDMHALDSYFSRLLTDG